MQQSEHKDNSARSNGGLSPKPPETLEKLLWLIKHGHRYWKLILLLVLVAFAYLVVSEVDWFSRNSKTVPKTFRFIDFEDAELAQLIEDSTGLTFDMSDDATYKIKFTYTPALRRATHEDKYLFDGGVAVVQIDHSECKKIREIRLQAWPDEPGNPKDLLERQIHTELEQKIKEHRELVAKYIIKCLRHEE